MTIYERIRDLRIKQNMSQQDLANKLGYTSRSTINKIEQGTRDIAQSKLEAFAIALRTTPAYLMGWEDEDYELPIVEVQSQIEYDSDTQEIISMYQQLDERDKGEIRGEIKQMLKAEKYRKKVKAG